MGADSVNGNGIHERSGAHAISLLATPLSALIVKALADGPKSHTVLLQDAGAPAQTTLRSMLRQLTKMAVIERRRRDEFPRSLEYELTAGGRELLLVLDALELWLDRAPDGPIALGGNAAKAAMKALRDGWSSTMLRALAAGPLSLKQLDQVIGSLTYPSLERRLAALRVTGQIEANARDGRSTPYAMTTWGREGVGPLVAAARWERLHLRTAAAPLRRVDAETIFLLAAPLLRPSPDLTGTCRMAIEVPSENGRRLAGVMVAVEGGRVTSCSSRLRAEADAWALGSRANWLEALGADPSGIESGGDGTLARALVDALRRALHEPQSVSDS